MIILGMIIIGGCIIVGFVELLKICVDKEMKENK